MKQTIWSSISALTLAQEETLIHASRCLGALSALTAYFPSSCCTETQTESQKPQNNMPRAELAFMQSHGKKVGKFRAKHCKTARYIRKTQTKECWNSA